MSSAHIAGVPVEEWLAPLLASGTGAAVAVRAALARLHRRRPPALRVGSHDRD